MWGNRVIWGVWGAGREGEASLHWLLKADPEAQIIVADENPQARLDGAGANVEIGDLSGLLRADVVIVSPGVPGVHPFRQVLADNGIRLTTGTCLWLDSHADTAIGVTGTKGKSTTAALIHALLRHCGNPARLAGNIGVPLLGLPPEAGTTVVELSSYQCHALTRSPRLAVIVNLYQEHLTWHGSLETYWRDKCHIFTQGAEILVADAATLATIRSLGISLDGLDVVTPSQYQVERTQDAISSLAESDVPLLFLADHGRHNLALALASVEAYGVSVSHEALAAVVASFEPLPHRMSLIRQAHGCQWYDDTLSTSAESVVAAASALEHTRRILIVGGQSRGISYQGLTNYLLTQRDNPVFVITIPSNGPTIAEGYSTSRPGFVRHAHDLTEAVRMAAEQTQPRDSGPLPSPRPLSVILSPGAPSYDLYPNYEAKSAAYARAIDELASDKVRLRAEPGDDPRHPRDTSAHPQQA